MSHISDQFLKFKSKRFLFYMLLILILYMIKFESNKNVTNNIRQLNNITRILIKKMDENNNLINFESFDNNTGLINQNYYIVPNIVHYVHLDQAVIKFPLFLSILSVWLNQKPRLIFLHCNDCHYKGKYWDELNRNMGIKSILRIKKILNFDLKIFEQKPGWIHHKSDTLRLLALMNYGGNLFR